MVDLSTEAVQKHWHEFGDPMIYRVITFMESVETWTKDGDPNIEETLKTLGTKIAQLQNVDIADFGHEEDVINISCNIKTGRALRLLQAFDQIQPGTASKLLAYAEEITNGPNDPAGIFKA